MLNLDRNFAVFRFKMPQQWVKLCTSRRRESSVLRLSRIWYKSRELMSIDWWYIRNRCEGNPLQLVCQYNTLYCWVYMHTVQSSLSQLRIERCWVNLTLPRYDAEYSCRVTSDRWNKSDTTRACNIYLHGVAFKRLHVSAFLHFRPSSGRKLFIEETVQYIQGVTGGMCETSGECSLGQTIPI